MNLAFEEYQLLHHTAYGTGHGLLQQFYIGVKKCKQHALVSKLVHMYVHIVFRNELIPEM